MSVEVYNLKLSAGAHVSHFDLTGLAHDSEYIVNGGCLAVVQNHSMNP